MIGGAVAAIVIVAEADFVLSVTAVAVTVTAAGVGTPLGAVETVEDPLPLAAGLKLPHCALPQVTDQLTPAFFASLATVAARFDVVLITIEDGGCVTNDTEIGGGGAVDVIVIDADTDLVLSVTEVAVIVTPV